MRGIVVAAVIAGLLAAAPSASADVICGCGFTFKETKAYNDNHLATASGRAQLRARESTPLRQQAIENWVIPDTTAIKAHTLRWFKDKYTKVGHGRDKAVKKCLIAGVSTFTALKATGSSTKEAEAAAAAACIAAVVAEILGGLDER